MNKFRYTDARNKFKVSKLVIYYWNEDAGNKSPKRTYSVGDNKYNVVFSYTDGNRKSIFSTWTENSLPKSDGGGS